MGIVDFFKKMRAGKREDVESPMMPPKPQAIHHPSLSDEERDVCFHVRDGLSRYLARNGHTMHTTDWLASVLPKVEDRALEVFSAGDASWKADEEYRKQVALRAVKRVTGIVCDGLIQDGLVHTAPEVDAAFRPDFSHLLEKPEPPPVEPEPWMMTNEELLAWMNTPSESDDTSSDASK